MVTIAEDITVRKRADAALHAREARIRTLLKMSVDWYWEQDADLRFTRVEGEGAHANRLPVD